MNMRKDPAVEELPSYHVAITSDHRLKVNNQEVGGDGLILAGDSESLLAWALEQVGYAQQNSATSISLQIEDHRPNGYGTRGVVIPPGQSVLIEELRKHTGRNLSHITEEVKARHEALQAADPAPQMDDPAPQPSEVEESPGSTDAPASPEPRPLRDEAPAREAAREEAPARATAPVVEPPAPAPESQVIEEVPSLAPVPAGPATFDHPGESAAPRRGRRERPQERPVQANPPQFEDTHAGEWQQSEFTEPLQPNDGLGHFMDQWKPQQDDFADEDLGREYSREDAPSQAPAVAEHEDITSSQMTYVRPRPELGEDEARKIVKPKKERSKPLIAALVAVSLLAAFFGFQYIQTRAENSYAATCIDERTMVRQASDDGCKFEEATYYRWWYTPKGSEVPAVNQTVSQAEGTRIKPENAQVREGYAPEGGLYGAE